jgi:hypothetical protein
MDQIISADRQDLSVLRPPERDLRLDLFRGVGQWMIFLDHIPHDLVNWLTLRNYGFSDAAEFFVFISGYLAGFIYGPAVRGGYFLAATNYTSPIFSCSCSLRRRSRAPPSASTTRCTRMNSTSSIFCSIPT